MKMLVDAPIILMMMLGISYSFSYRSCRVPRLHRKSLKLRAGDGTPEKMDSVIRELMNENIKNEEIFDVLFRNIDMFVAEKTNPQFLDVMQEWKNRAQNEDERMVLDRIEEVVMEFTGTFVSDLAGIDSSGAQVLDMLKQLPPEQVKEVLQDEKIRKEFDMEFIRQHDDRIIDSRKREDNTLYDDATRDNSNKDRKFYQDLKRQVLEIVEGNNDIPPHIQVVRDLLKINDGILRERLLRQVGDKAVEDGGVNSLSIFITDVRDTLLAVEANIDKYDSLEPTFALRIKDLLKMVRSISI